MRDKFESTAHIKIDGVSLSLIAYFWGKNVDVNDLLCDSIYRFRKAVLVGINFKPKMV
jgi:hypothetical protein